MVSVFHHIKDAKLASSIVCIKIQDFKKKVFTRPSTVNLLILIGKNKSIFCNHLYYSDFTIYLFFEKRTKQSIFCNHLYHSVFTIQKMLKINKACLKWLKKAPHPTGKRTHRAPWPDSVGLCCCGGCLAGCCGGCHCCGSCSSGRCCCCC